MSSVVILDSGSDCSSSCEESYEEKEEESQLFAVLKSFFMNDKNENIATILTNLTNEIKMLREQLNLK